MSEENSRSGFRLDLAFAHLLLRLWVAERLIMAGVDKFRKGSTSEGATFNMENYKAKSQQIADLMASNSFLPKWMCEQYAMGIGFALLGVGAWVLLGLFTEWRLRPFVADPSLDYFLHHLGQLTPVTIGLVALGAVIAYFFVAGFGSRK